MPDPYRRLLVHDRDMTPTLEAAHGRKIHVRVLKYMVDDDAINRLVVLVLDDDETAVEVGAIRIFLGRLPPAARQLVLQHREPFGTILRENAVPHSSRPAGYFQVTADSLLAGALRLNESGALYGRRNTIWSSDGETLAEVVEILPLLPDP